MFCDNCGTNNLKSQQFCDNCGHKFIATTVATPKKLAELSEDKKPATISLIPANNNLRKGLILLTILLLVFYVVNQRNQNRLTQELQEQRQQTKDLLVQIQTSQEQNSKTNQEISDQLAEQKAKAEKTSLDLAAAQKKLAAQQSSTPVKTNSDLSLHDFNTKAIVMIICVDDAGSAQAGSGVIISSSGHVLTNKHVVTDSAGRLETCVMALKESDSVSPLKSSILYRLAISELNTGLYPNFDAAILKVSSASYSSNSAPAPLPSAFPFLKPATGGLKQGDAIYILGYPGASNFIFSVFRGIISSFSDTGLYINTDAVIDHGNSGGAAVTADGRFVGIPTQKYVGNGDYLGQILRLDNLNIPTF